VANPQAEDGHIDIANEIGEALCRINLSAYENRVVWFILRKTYGWHKKMDRISYSQFEQGTGIDRRHLGRTIKTMIKRQMITCSGNGRLLEYGFQKDYEKWDTPVIAYLGNDTLPKEATLQKRDKNVTDNVTERDSEKASFIREGEASLVEKNEVAEKGTFIDEIIAYPGTDHCLFRDLSLPKEANTKETIQKKLTKERDKEKDRTVLDGVNTVSSPYLDQREEEIYSKHFQERLERLLDRPPTQRDMSNTVILFTRYGKSWVEDALEDAIINGESTLPAVENILHRRLKECQK